MKLLTEEQLAGHQRAVYRGALEGTLFSGLTAGAGLLWAQRRFPAVRAWPLPAKAFAIVLVTAPCLSIQAERRGLQFEQSQWEGESVELLRAKEAQEEARWQQLTTGDKIRQWFLSHQYTAITGAWAASLLTAGAIISRQKGSTGPQKLVQARMYAQAFTIALLIGAGVLNSREKALHPPDHVDHSWVQVLAEREEEAKHHKELLANKGIPA